MIMKKELLTLETIRILKSIRNHYGIYDSNDIEKFHLNHSLFMIG